MLNSLFFQLLGKEGHHDNELKCSAAVLELEPRMKLLERDLHVSVHLKESFILETESPE
jgi:hypothetical protein